MATTVPATGVTGAASELYAAYAARAESLGFRAERAADSAEAAASIATLAAALAAPGAVVAAALREAAPRLMAAIEARGVRWEPAAAPETARDAPFGIGLARLAVAETGSVLLAEETLADRAVGLVAIAHLVLCRTADLVPSLAEAAVVLREIAARPGGGYASLVTGPSRTADIEMSLTVGVQGPARFFVLFVDDLT